MNSKSSLRLLFSLNLLLFTALPGVAQNVTATISGGVKDQSGAVVPGVKVTASNTATTASRSVVTNDRGEFVIPLLSVGTYSAIAELPGFKTEVRDGLILQVDQRVTINFELQVGQLSERFVVIEQQSLAQAETSDIGAIIENQRVVQLPLNGREFEKLALLVPGAIKSDFRGTLTFAGSRGTTAISLDGIDMIDTVTNTPVLRPSVDAIQEFKVQTSRYSAELGRVSGGQVNVTTKSGSNQIHGTAYEFFRNNVFDAKNYFEPADKEIPPYRRNNFGVTIGGPIVRDQTFFFVNYEGLRLNQSITKTASVPSAAMVAGDFSELSTPIRDPLTGQPFPGNVIPQSRINSIGQAIANFYPKPNLGTAVRSFVSSPVDTRRIDQGTFRVDHRLTDRNSIFARYTVSDDSELDPFDVFSGITNLPGYGRIDDQFGSSISVVDTHVFSSSMVGEFRLGYNRFSQFRAQEAYKENIPAQLGIPGTSKDPIDWGYPTVLVTGFDTIGKTNTPTDRQDNTYQGVAAITYTRNNHTFKFGSDAQWFQSNRLNNGSSRGVFNFSGQYSGNALADLLLGYPRQTSRALGDSRHPHATWAFSHYFQDDWKVTSRLTLNLGIRYDWQTDVIAANDRQSSFNPETGFIEITGGPSTRRDISRPDLYYPELAVLAQSIKMVDVGRRNLVTYDKNDIAPRFGLAFRILDQDRLVLRTGYGIYYNQALLAAPGWKNYPYFVNQTFNANATVPNISISDPFPGSLASSTVSPSSLPYRDRTMYVQQFNLGLQYQPLRDVLVDVGYVGSKTTHVGESRNINQPLPAATGSVASRRPYQGFGNISLSSNSGSAHFDSLQVKVEKRSSRGLTVMGSYAWSKSMANSSLNPGQPENYNRGVTGSNVPHLLTISSVYALPFGANNRFFPNAPRVADWLISGWELSGIWTVQSGSPFTPRIRADNSNTGSGGSDRPNLVGDPVLPSDQRSPNRWFNTSAFAIPSRGTFGNLGLNTLVGPGVNNLDFALMKRNRISEGMSLQFRVEAFNLANHPNFALPNSDVDSTQFGQIFETVGFSRQLQFGLKLIY
jgi:hypothetical protein